eukprot:1083919-Prorocentrum_minimum.AAC.1
MSRLKLLGALITATRSSSGATCAGDGGEKRSAVDLWGSKRTYGVRNEFMGELNRRVTRWAHNKS